MTLLVGDIAPSGGGQQSALNSRNLINMKPVSMLGASPASKGKHKTSKDTARTHSRVPRCPLRGRYGDTGASLADCAANQPRIFPEWMDLKTAQTYICASERTLREWIHRDSDPLPAVRDGEGKIFISRTRLDQWMLNHPLTSEKPDLDAIVNEVISGLAEAH